MILLDPTVKSSSRLAPSLRYILISSNEVTSARDFDGSLAKQIAMVLLIVLMFALIVCLNVVFLFWVIAGTAIAARIAMIDTTIMISTKVKCFVFIYHTHFYSLKLQLIPPMYHPFITESWRIFLVLEYG